MPECPVDGCIRGTSERRLMCRPHWSMVRGGDGGALAREVYRTFSAFEAGWASLKDLRAVQGRAIAKANARQRELHGRAE